MTGSLYEVYEPLDTKQLRPVGEFNHSRIVVRGSMSSIGSRVVK